MNTTIENINTGFFKKLEFRRQFIVGPREYLPNEYWGNIKLRHGLQLSHHKDLPVTLTATDNTLFCLLGIAIDPFNTSFNESQILDSIKSRVNDFESLIKLCTPLAGRWIMIFQDEYNSFVFTDPAGLRTVFYISEKNDFWFASQPELIKKQKQLFLTDEKALLSFLLSTELGNRESMWIGKKTIYDLCYHLLPNHYLDINNIKQVRFYPLISILPRDPKEVIELSAAILQGIYKSIALRYKFRIAITSGRDSRVLLAASKFISQSTEYHVDRMGILKAEHPDVYVPEKISAKLGLKLIVENSKFNLPGWFTSYLSLNVTNARALPKTKSIFNRLLTWNDYLNINGNISEICRNRFLDLFNGNLNDISSSDMAKLYGFPDSKFVIEEIDDWRRTLVLSNNNNPNILDLLYWEQKMGNYGSQYPNEQDIAIDEISPFNCRLLIDTLLSSPREMRSAPDYKLYQELIKFMWPELLEYPINPKNKPRIFKSLKETIRPHVSDNLIKNIKTILRINAG